MPDQPTATRIGPYRLLARIGEGGMGVVHLAEAPDGSRVALKVLRPHVVGDDEARERFVREVASLRRVAGPWVAEVLDADPWHETPYVATRYVPGPSLHEHVRRDGPVLGVDLAHLATGLMEAVVAVHRAGVLHRDVKPSNVLLEGRSPVLIDFGVARLAEDPRLTQTGWLVGTPGYLAPEVLYGEDATPASDVHSWAATMVFAATGRHPFGGGPAMAVLDRVRRGEHDVSAVPPALLPIVTDCLAPEPADRPATAAVLAALRRSTPAVPALRTRASATREVRAMAPVGASGPPRTRLLTATAPAPFPAPPATPLTVQAPHPAPPAAAGAAVPPAPLPGPPSAAPGQRWQRAGLLGGLFAGVAVGFARAPYLSLLVLACVVLVLRTVSWTSEVARQRRELRGRRRWYDGPLTVLSLPWYVLVASGGTLVLLVWAAAAAFAVGFAWLLFGGPPQDGLLFMGALVALSLWWGPASRRVRGPTRRLVARATRHPGTGWVAVVSVGVLVTVLSWALAGAGVVWAPATGAPWAPGTVLGDLLRWL